MKIVCAPEIVEQGFAFDGKRTFRKPLDLGECTAVQIIEFQIGIKRLTGRYTVNLGVYSSAYSVWDDDVHLQSATEVEPIGPINPMRTFFD